MTTISFNHTELQQLAEAVGQIPMTKDGSALERGEMGNMVPKFAAYFYREIINVWV